jgi:hypothetical protein
VCNLLRAFGCKLIEAINELGIPATLLDEAVQPVATIAPAFLTTHAQEVELADEIAEDDLRRRGKA